MLLSYMILGMLFNVSMWYKLSGKTGVAIYITMAGLVVTAAVNMIFMPKYSYYAAAWGHLASYVVMFVVSAVLGNRYYPIPYKWGRIACIFAAMGVFYGIASVVDRFFFDGVTFAASVSGMVLKLAVNTVFILLYMLFVWKAVHLGNRAFLSGK